MPVWAHWEDNMGSNQLGDPEQWVDRFGDYLYRNALHRLRDTEAAEDVVQETLLAALAARDSFSGRSSARTWLIGILKNKIVDHIRKRSRERPFAEFESGDAAVDELFADDGQWRRESPETRPLPWRSDPRQLARDNEFLEILDRCLEGVPERLAKAFILREIDDMSTQEVCQVLNVTSTNLWVMLHRARMRLRRCLEVNWFGVKRGESD